MHLAILDISKETLIPILTGSCGEYTPDLREDLDDGAPPPPP